MAGRSRRARSIANQKAAPDRSSGSALTRSNAAATQAVAPKESGGILGWFQSAGDSIANTYDSVTSSVGSAIDATTAYAKDAWDVVESTDLSWQDGKIGVETDLDEVLDLLPDSYRDKLKLGDQAENRMAMTFDTSTGGMNLSSDALDIESMDLGGVKTGAASFQGVNINVGNVSEALGLRDNEGGVNIDASVQNANIQNLQMQGADGPISVANLNVADFKASGANSDGLPFGDQTSTRASFSAGSANLSGVTSGKGTVDQISVGSIAGGLSERDESAWLEAGSVKTGGVKGPDGIAMGNGSASDVRVDIRNQDGGMVLLDDKADHMQARVTAGSLSASDVSAAGATLGQAGASGLVLNANQDTGALSAELAKANVAGLSSEQGKLTSATATGSSLRMGGGSTNLSVDQLNVTGAKTDAFSVSGATASQVSATLQGENTNVSAQTLGMTDFAASDFKAGTVQAKQASASLNANGLTAGVGSATVTDASVRDTPAIDKASVTGVSGSIVGDQRSTDVQSATVQGLTYLPTGTTVQSGSLTGLSGESQGDALKASLASGSVTGVRSGDIQVGGGSVNGVNYSGTPDQNQISADKISMSQANMGTTAGADSVVATGAYANFGKDGPKGGVKHLDGTGLRFAAPSSSSQDSSGPGVDTASLIRTASQRVASADVAMSVPMAAGEYKTGVGLDVGKNTQLDAKMAVRNNQLTNVNAQFSNPVGGPLWTSLNGVYTKDGALEADVGGFFDQTISGDINEAMGLQGEKLKSVGAYGNAIAGQMGGPASGPSTGAPGLEAAFDLDAMSLNANAQLSAGTIDAGMGSVTLQNGGANTNRFSATSQRGGNLNVSADRLLASRGSASLGDLDLSVGQTEIDHTKISAGKDGVRGQVGKASVDDLTFE